MRVLVTGGNGFAGRHLVSELAAHGHSPVAFDVAFDEDTPTTRIGDLTDAQAVAECVRELQPDACVHLGAIAFVPDAVGNPQGMLTVNVAGTLNLLEAFVRHAPEARVLVASTARVYEGRRDSGPIDESATLAPVSLYAVSKAAADLATLAYAGRHSLHAMTARPNNHTGPGQTAGFVVAAFVRQIKAVARGEQEPRIRVGNLESERSFCDVRDVVRAYRLLIEQGTAGQAYNISCPQQVTIGRLLKTICRLAGVEAEFVRDESLYRPTDRSPELAVARLKQETGWEARIPFEQTLVDMLEEA